MNRGDEEFAKNDEQETYDFGVDTTLLVGLGMFNFGDTEALDFIRGHDTELDGANPSSRGARMNKLIGIHDRRWLRERE